MTDLRIYDGPGSRVPRGQPVTLSFEGDPVPAFADEPVAVALFASGARALSRSLKYHRPRSFFCLAGHCGSCLMRVGGRPNVRTCQVACSDGLAVAGQNAWPSAAHDSLGIIDWFFPHGMDHHRMFTGVKIVNSVMQKFVRQLSGLGKLPDQPASPLPIRGDRVDVLVVGGGPAGLAAAQAAARAGARVLCIDEQTSPGGSLLSQPGGRERASQAATAAVAAGAELLAASPLVGYYPEDAGGLAAVRTAAGLRLVSARRTVHATGGYDQNALFPDNDRPGVLAARALGRLLLGHGVRPAERVVIVGEAPYAATLAGALAAEKVEAVTLTAAQPIQRVHGRGWVTGVDAAGRGRIECQLVAVAATPAPASEAARQYGAQVTLSRAGGGFCVVIDEAGRTSVPGVLACGDVTGFMGPEAAARQGAAVGALAAEARA